jgi:hypothetical protein
MAYAHDWTTDPGGYNVTKKILDGVVTLSRYIDTTKTGYDVGSGEYIKLFSVPANFAVLEAYIVTGTAEGTDALDLVDDDSATTTFVNNHPQSAGTVTATNARKLYTSAGYLVIHGDAAHTTGAFWVVVRGILLNTSM